MCLVVACNALDQARTTQRYQRRGRDSIAGLKGLAQRWDLSLSQLAIGWALGKQPQFVPTLGMRTLSQLERALAARPLTAEQLAEVEAIAPRGSVQGTRYPVAHMAALDSEKR